MQDPPNMDRQSRPPATPGNEPLIGVRLDGRYLVESHLGGGGMGQVYRARHVKLDGAVAIKVLHHTLGSNEEVIERFIKEARIACKIRHENIVQVFDIGTTPMGSVFFAMELLEGEDLERRLQSLGRLTWEQALPIVRQLCRALEAVHGHRIIHRDLKPANCFLVPAAEGRDRLKLVDFGIAKVSETISINFTKAGTVMGTAPYMAPEQVTAAELDHRVDIYAFGVILFELLTGRHPFIGANLVEISMRILNAPIPRLESVYPDIRVPHGVQSLIDRALSKLPDDRFSNVTEILHQLDTIERGVVVPASTVALPGIPTTPLAPPLAHASAPPTAEVAAAKSGQLAPSTEIVGGRVPSSVESSRRPRPNEDAGGRWRVFAAIAGLATIATATVIAWQMPNTWTGGPKNAGRVSEASPVNVDEPSSSRASPHTRTPPSTMPQESSSVASSGLPPDEGDPPRPSTTSHHVVEVPSDSPLETTHSSDVPKLATISTPSKVDTPSTRGGAEPSRAHDEEQKTTKRPPSPKRTPVKPSRRSRTKTRSEVATTSGKSKSPRRGQRRLDPGQIDRTMKRINVRVLSCGGTYDAAPNTVVRVTLKIDAMGQVTGARALPPHYASALGKCVAAAVKGARFPTNAGPSTTHTHSFRF